MKWTSQQDVVLRDCARWVADPRGEQIKTVFGYAGTGKTTLARELVQSSRAGWIFAAFTGKAALVMRQRGCVGARTIHSLIYRPAGEKNTNGRRILELEKKLLEACTAEKRAIAEADPGPTHEAPSVEEKTGGQGVDFKKLGDEMRRKRVARQDAKVIEATAEISRVELELERARRENKSQPAYSLWDESPLRDAPGVVLDECSMVDEEVGADLISFGKKILVLGDPAQLPPVGAGGYFTERKPDHMLTEVHRQARDSGVLDLATYVREGGDVMARAADRWCREDCEVVFAGTNTDRLRARVLAADQVILGTNKKRHAFNARHRELLGRTTLFPEIGDKVICLRNDRDMGLLNGSMWRVRDSSHDPDKKMVGMEIVADGSLDPDAEESVAVRCWDHHFVGRESALQEMGWSRRHEQEFDHAYAITCHKSQGSQWDDVVVFDESRTFKGADMQRRWLYTAVTRAAKQLMVVV